ncbi:amino acid transporter [Nadsonia fulvescens var. elongata DSM 6958]|uniref:Amino acid transporter n=1 Tax=Nadsonia fulvescens var. elongata DSM 6958 TaxID=857566 RepID=A0A1E3PLB4_9ASCO|nr:amino acid transporter [Nadsonia fulvescens var. elongata DSM 6958]
MGFQSLFKKETFFNSSSVASSFSDEKESQEGAFGLGTMDPSASSSELGEPLKKDIGVFSAIFLIFNRMVGTGIFATPATIYVLCGSSVGLSLFIWVIGAIIAAAGMTVYLEWGTFLPKNGGEKNYLEYVYKKPAFLITSMFASYVFFLGWAAPNSIVFGQYILAAAGVETTRWNQRGLGIACVTFSFLVHSINVKWGVRLQNLLGFFKLVVMVVIVVTGFVGLGGGLKHNNYTKTDNFTDAFSSVNTVSAYGIVMALYNVIWSFIGYSNANYALSEAKDPMRVLKISAPFALGLVSLLYILVIIGYYAVVPGEIMKNSGTILASNFFLIAFGETGKKALNAFVALSALGNVLSVIFSQGRIIQSLAHEDVLPASKIWASSKPFKTPFAGLFQHWVVCVITIIAPPPGDAYNFISNLITYPLSIVNVFVSVGLIYVHFTKDKYYPDFSPKIKSPLIVTAFFALSSIYLVVAPYVPPSDGQSVYKSIPYYLHCVVGIAMFAVGGMYWFIWRIVWPKVGNFEWERVTIKKEGWDYAEFKRVKKNI